MTEIINPQLGQDGRAYYTIAMPTDPAQADILREFVQAQGWGVVQTVPPVQECVQRQDFLRTSREHWMAGHYGQLAYDILSAELPKLPGAQTHEPRRGALYRNSEGAVYLPAVRHLPELTVVDDTRPEVIRDLFLGRWEDATVPYPVAVNLAVALAADGATRSRMSRAARAMAKPDAARVIVDRALELVRPDHRAR